MLVCFPTQFDDSSVLQLIGLIFVDWAILVQIKNLVEIEKISIQPPFLSPDPSTHEGVHELIYLRFHQETLLDPRYCSGTHSSTSYLEGTPMTCASVYGIWQPACFDFPLSFAPTTQTIDSIICKTHKGKLDRFYENKNTQSLLPRLKILYHFGISRCIILIMYF